MEAGSSVLVLSRCGMLFGARVVVVSSSGEGMPTSAGSTGRGGSVAGAGGWGSVSWATVVGPGSGVGDGGRMLFWGVFGVSRLVAMWD